MGVIGALDIFKLILEINANKEIPEAGQNYLFLKKSKQITLPY